MNRKKLTLLVCSAAIASSALAFGSIGDPVTIPTDSYPGIACQAFRSGEDTGYRSIDGSIINQTSSFADYLCPIQMEDVYKGSATIDGSVYVVDAHDDAAVTCHIYTYTNDRMPNGWQMKSTSRYGFSSSVQRLGSFYVPTAKFSHATLRCSVPARQYSRDSAVVNYHLR